MNTQKSVYNKLFKEETQLASHSVELTLVADLKKALSEFNKVSALDDTLRTKFSQIKQEAKNIVTQCENSKKVFLSYQILIQGINQTLPLKDTKLFCAINHFFIILCNF